MRIGGTTDPFREKNEDEWHRSLALCESRLDLFGTKRLNPEAEVSPASDGGRRDEDDTKHEKTAVHEVENNLLVNVSRLGSRPFVGTEDRFVLLLALDNAHTSTTASCVAMTPMAQFLHCRPELLFPTICHPPWTVSKGSLLLPVCASPALGHRLHLPWMFRGQSKP